MEGTWLASRVVMLIPLLLSLTVHEWAHALAADRLGDDTARRLGRLTLDPLAHIDPIGTLILPLLGVPFGWAKPVPVNPLRFVGVSERGGMLLVAAAGPASNFVLALVSAAALGVAGRIAPALVADGAVLAQVLQTAIVLNVLLACFNLLPIPPLDGSRVVDGLVPARLQPLWSRVHALGGVLLVALIVLPVFVGVDLLAGPRAIATALVALAR
jgi:Zn-dependent protease